MTALDIIVIVLVGGSAISGYRRGFVHEILSVAAWIAALFTAKALHAPVAEALAGAVGTSFGATALAFMFVFGVVFATAKFFAARFGGATRKSLVGPIDRILGIGFGALKGLLGATLLFLVATLVTPRTDKPPAWLTDARTYPLLNASSRALVDFVDRRRNAPPPTDEELNR